MKTILLLLFILQDPPVAGPITEVLERRFDTLAERFDAWAQGSTLAITRLETAQHSRFSEVLTGIREAATERKTLLTRIEEARQDRVGLLARIAEVRAELAETRKEFKPLQSIVDRLIALVWKLFFLMVSLAILLAIILAVCAWLWKKIANLIPG